MGLWLGVDGGGTKTAFALYGREGDGAFRLIDRMELGTCHWAQVGGEGMAGVLMRGADWARERADELDETLLGAGFGICGYGEVPEADRAIDRAARDAAAGLPHLVVNDVVEAWAAGLGLADGIVLIAGTGSIAFGVNGARSMRCGGWDYPLGDEGSGGWLGMQALIAFTRQADGRDARGPLYDMVRDELGLERDFDLIPFAQAHLTDRGRISQLAPIVTAAARKGDGSALRILRRAAHEEADTVAAIVSGIFPDGDGPVPVTYIGGTFQAGDCILGPLAEELPARCRLTPPLHEPELGAVLLLASGRDVPMA